MRWWVCGTQAQWRVARSPLNGAGAGVLAVTLTFKVLLCGNRGENGVFGTRGGFEIEL